MPAKTERQARFMRLCAHSPGKAKGKCPSKAVAREFMHTKKRRKKRTVPKPNKHGFY